MSKVQGAAMGHLQTTTQVFVQRVRAMHCIKLVAYIFSCETPRTWQGATDLVLLQAKVGKLKQRKPFGWCMAKHMGAHMADSCA